jgi:hypothetical protein
MLLKTGLWSRVARWFVFKPEISIWVNFGGPWNRKCGYILWPFGIFYGHLEYFMAIWYNLLPFGIVCGYLVYFSRFGAFGPRKIWQPCSDPGIHFRRALSKVLSNLSNWFYSRYLANLV